MIKLNDVTKIYDQRTLRPNVAVNHVSLEIKEKGIVSLFGPSGCGKTTLLNLITGMDRPTSGSVTIDGKEVDDDYRLSNIGLVYQDFVLCDDLTVEENITIVDKSLNGKEVDETLNSLGILSLKERKAGRLSGGEKQRVSIARAIVKKPRFIVCDEPTGNLDEKNRILIMDILKSLSKHYLVIVVSHDRELTEEYSDRIIFLEDGSLVRDVVKKEMDEEGGREEERKVLYRPTYSRFYKAKTNYIAIFLTMVATVFTCACYSLIMDKPKGMNHSPAGLFSSSEILSEQEFAAIKTSAEVFWKRNVSSSIVLSAHPDDEFGSIFSISEIAYLLPETAIGNLEVGEKDLKEGEIVISSGLADAILKKARQPQNIDLAHYGIKVESDLIGLSFLWENKRIVGIAEEPQYAVYTVDSEFFNPNSGNLSNPLRAELSFGSSWSFVTYMSFSRFNGLYGTSFTDDDLIVVDSNRLLQDETGTISDRQTVSFPLGGDETFSKMYRYEVSASLQGKADVLLPDYLFYLISPDSGFYSSDPNKTFSAISANKLPVKSFYQKVKDDNAKTNGLSLAIFGSVLLALILVTSFFLNVDLASYLTGQKSELTVLRSLGVNKKTLIGKSYVSVMRSVIVSSLIGLGLGSVVAVYLQKFSPESAYFLLVDPLTVIISFAVSLLIVSLIVWAFLRKKFMGTAATFKRLNKD